MNKLSYKEKFEIAMDAIRWSIDQTSDQKTKAELRGLLVGFGEPLKGP